MKIGRQQLSALILFFAVAVVHHYFFYTPVVKERLVRDSLHAINNTVAAGDSARIREEAMSYLDSDSKIHLELTYTSIESTGEDADKPAITYDFSKYLFNAYLDNMFRSLTDFTFHSVVHSFDIDKDWKTAKVVIVSDGSAVGSSRFVTKERASRFSFQAACEVNVSLTGDRPIAKTVDCKLFVPRPEPLS